MTQPLLTPQELDDVKDYVLDKLPRVLEQDPRFVLFIEGIVNEKFPRRDEFARLLDEFTSFRKETRENFDQVDHRFNLVDQRFESLTQEVRNLRDWVEVIAGGLQNRAGKNLERIVAGALQLGLRRPDIQPEHILLRQKISDPEGLVFKAGKQKEVDIVAMNGELLVFEVKSAPKPDDVDDFADKVELVRLHNPEKNVQGVFVAVGSEDRIRQICRQRKLLLIPES
jgi:hypothetical protein